MDYSLAALLPRLFISMAVVIAVMWFAAKVMKNKRLPGIGGGVSKAEAKRNQIDVLSRQGLHKNATATLVRVGGKTLLLGVTDMNVTLLAELDEATETTPLALVPQQLAQVADAHTDAQRTDVVEPAWKGLLEQARERTLRRA